ncbi:hypothetical protein DPMN_182081 [Dreissena polymorpha]|uniref:Uncharacterized protein n=1 Tax=Dreissena polymorpha TaxID=45954 RepID=A0A9D4DGG4_DREPO|nr:hypothetical protein DPMN_182081 [Dreissena polymorpha]
MGSPAQVMLRVWTVRSLPADVPHHQRSARERSGQEVVMPLRQTHPRSKVLYFNMSMTFMNKMTDLPMIILFTSKVRKTLLLRID